MGSWEVEEGYFLGAEPGGHEAGLATGAKEGGTSKTNMVNREAEKEQKICGVERTHATMSIEHKVQQLAKRKRKCTKT